MKRIIKYLGIFLFIYIIFGVTSVYADTKLWSCEYYSQDSFANDYYELIMYEKANGYIYPRMSRHILNKENPEDTATSYDNISIGKTRKCPTYLHLKSFGTGRTGYFSDAEKVTQPNYMDYKILFISAEKLPSRPSLTCEYSPTYDNDGDTLIYTQHAAGRSTLVRKESGGKETELSYGYDDSVNKTKNVLQAGFSSCPKWLHLSVQAVSNNRYGLLSNNIFTPRENADYTDYTYLFKYNSYKPTPLNCLYRGETVFEMFEIGRSEKAGYMSIVGGTYSLPSCYGNYMQDDPSITSCPDTACFMDNKMCLLNFSKKGLIFGANQTSAFKTYSDSAKDDGIDFALFKDISEKSVTCFKRADTYEPSDPGIVDVDDCDSLLGGVMEVLNTIFNLIKIAVPILVVVLGAIDFTRAVFASEDKDVKKAQSRFVKRLLIGALIFFIPQFIQFIMQIISVVNGCELK